MQPCRLQAQQGLAALAQVGEGGAPIRVQAELVHQARRIRDDGVEARLDLRQGGGRRLWRAQVFALGQQQGAALAAGARQVQAERIQAAIAAALLHVQQGLCADAVVQGRQHGGQLLRVELRRQGEGRHRQQLLARVLQVVAGGIVGVQ